MADDECAGNECICSDPTPEKSDELIARMRSILESRGRLMALHEEDPPRALCRMCGRHRILLELQYGRDDDCWVQVCEECWERLIHYPGPQKVSP